MNARRLIVFPLLTMAAAATAADSGVYESFSGVGIGRVFLTPAERDRLDTERLNPPSVAVSGSHEAAEATEKPKRKLPSAGYIRRGNGPAKVWQNGDFVDFGRNAPDSMAFPGDVEITRHVTSAKPQPAPNAIAEPPAGSSPGSDSEGERRDRSGADRDAE